MVDYTLTELMAVAAAREIEDGEVVFAGTGLPMLGAMLAQRTHAPECCIIFVDDSGFQLHYKYMFFANF